LKRPDSAKEIQGFSLQKFDQALLDEARIWLDLDSAWVPIPTISLRQIVYSSRRR
jgi:hypothetical protein